MKNLLAPLTLALALLVPVHPALAQYVPEGITHEGIYRFLDELASDRLIELNSLVKPYGRGEIARYLAAADTCRSRMTPRQRAELDFYLKDFLKELPRERVPAVSWFWKKRHEGKRFDIFYYSDSLFRLTVNPIVGADVWVNANGGFYHWWNGVEARATIGGFGFWASLRDNHESVELTARDFQNSRVGGANIKVHDGTKRDYEEFRGGITYGWDWGHAGLIMDQFAWGENNAGANILSGRTPAFPRLELSLDPTEWFSFEYVYCSLYSEVVDSVRSFYTTSGGQTDFREVYHSKYLSANMFSFTPFRGLQLSIGNSIVHDTDGPEMSFLIPVAFYKAIDHSLNARKDNMNSQLFLSLSSRNLRGFHFHGTIFIDELATDRFFDPDEYNFVSYKAGLSTTIPRNFRFAAEYTWTNTLTFMHYVPTTTFESNQYNLGHYLEDNGQEVHVSASWRPWRTLDVSAWFNYALKGPDHTELGTPRLGIDPFDPVVWESTRAGILATVQVVNGLWARLGFEWRNVTGEQAYLDRWTPGVYHGETATVRFGLNYGF